MNLGVIGGSAVRGAFAVPGAAVLLMSAASVLAQGAPVAYPQVEYRVVGDLIPASLTGASGDAARGRQVVTGRESNCILCHAFPDVRAAGDIGPPLAGVGARLQAGQLRLRLVDSTKLNPSTVMPAYYRTDGLTRVASAYQGKTVLNAEQIEDAVAYLLTLK